MMEAFTPIQASTEATTIITRVNAKEIRYALSVSTHLIVTVKRQGLRLER